MGGNWEKSKYDNRIELRSAASNCTVMTCWFDVFAGQALIRSTLGVEFAPYRLVKWSSLHAWLKATHGVLDDYIAC
jgi:hypothetical protein